MANLKNITDLPMAASAEGLNLIVNDNGAAKQIAAGTVGVKSYNDLEDKPFYTEVDDNGNETIHKLDAKYLPNIGGGGGHWVLVDYTGDHGIVTASDGIFEALKNFLDNGVCTPVAVYMRRLIDGNVVIWSHCVEDIAWMSDNIIINTEIRHDYGLAVYIYPNGEHDYYLE